MQLSNIIIPDGVFKRMTNDNLIKLKEKCEQELSEREKVM